MSEHIITLDDLVKRDGKVTVAEWIVAACATAIQQKRLAQGWDGVSVSGTETVEAVVNAGRWISICPTCNNPSYVTPVTPIFYCTVCGNNGTQEAWNVHFPAEREEIETLMLAREVALPEGYAPRNEIEAALVAQAALEGFERYWTTETSIETVRSTNAFYLGE